MHILVYMSIVAPGKPSLLFYGAVLIAATLVYGISLFLP